MDCSKVGGLIFRLRKEKNMTQKELADIMNISDKTISKWERGMGCPDVSLLHELSEIFGVNIEKILSGSLDANDVDGGNMKKIKFYVCSDCGNIISATGDGDISCCGRKLSPLLPKIVDDSHRAKMMEIENDLYITFDHEMTKSHYISFIAHVSYDRVLIIRMYPEQSPEVRFPKYHKGKVYFYCTQHGLWTNKI